MGHALSSCCSSYPAGLCDAHTPCALLGAAAWPEASLIQELGHLHVRNPLAEPQRLQAGWHNVKQHAFWGPNLTISTGIYVRTPALGLHLFHTDLIFLSKIYGTDGGHVCVACGTAVGR